MTGRIVFMTEEPSMDATLRNLLPKLFPDFREFEHWLIIHHQGKSDLERSYPRKMKEWREPGVRFIILRDNDGSDCLVLKQKLVSKVPNSAPGYLVRIVCQELESWFLGDMPAVAAAYPTAAKHQQFKALSKRDPDNLTNASELIKQLTGTQTKIGRAAEIAKQMQPANNRSTSFQVFVNGLSSFLSA
jgi:hypothetical protein